MSNIKRFTLDHSTNTLLVNLTNQQSYMLSYEYLRVLSQWQPNANNTANSTAKSNLPSHKKSVQLISLESVAQHGFRYGFDDGYNVIVNEQQLCLLAQQYDNNWQQYLSALKAQHLSREANIDIKQL